MIVGLKIKHGADVTCMIHRIDQWTIDDNDNNRILITSHDATKNYSSKKKKVREISEYVVLKPIQRRRISKSEKYFAVWRNAPKDFTSIYYPCKIARNENQRIKATRTTIKINYCDPNYKNKNFLIRFSHTFNGEDVILPSIIEAQKLTSLVFYICLHQSRLVMCCFLHFCFVFLVVLCSTEEDIVSFYGKNKKQDVDKEKVEKPLKSRLRQQRRVRYNYSNDDDDNSENENNRNEYNYNNDKNRNEASESEDEET